MTASIHPIPVRHSRHLNIVRNESATIIILPVIRIERYGDEDQPNPVVAAQMRKHDLFFSDDVRRDQR